MVKGCWWYVYIYIYMSPIPFGLMRLGFLSSVMNTQANFCCAVLVFAYNNRQEITHHTRSIYYISYAIYHVLHTMRYVSILYNIRCILHIEYYISHVMR